MKVAIIVLLACVAVSQAAFTANLVQRAQPALRQALFKVRLAGGRSDLQTPIGQALADHANELLANIQNAVSTGQQIATSVVNELTSTWEQMQALGSNVMGAGQDILGNLMSGLGNLFGGMFGRQKSIGAIVDFVQNFDLQATIDGLLAHAQNLVSQLDLGQMLQSVLGHLMGRGMFADMWNQISATAGNAWEAMQNMVGQITTVAGNAMTTVQTMAQEFVTEATENIHSMTTQAANDFLAFLKPYQTDLGTLYDQVVAQVSQIGKN